MQSPGSKWNHEVRLDPLLLQEQFISKHCFCYWSKFLRIFTSKGKKRNPYSITSSSVCLSVCPSFHVFLRTPKVWTYKVEMNIILYTKVNEEIKMTCKRKQTIWSYVLYILMCIHQNVQHIWPYRLIAFIVTLKGIKTQRLLPVQIYQETIWYGTNTGKQVDIVRQTFSKFKNNFEVGVTLGIQLPKNTFHLLSCTMTERNLYLFL